MINEAYADKPVSSRKSTVSEGLHRIDTSLDRLISAVSALDERLKEVLMPRPAAKCEISEMTPFSGCDLGKALNGFADHLDDQVTRLIELYETVDL